MKSISKYVLTAILALSFSATASAAVQTSFPITFDVYDGPGATCKLSLIANYDPVHKPVSGYKPMLFLNGQGWKGVQRQYGTGFVESITTEGYMVYSIDYRGVIAGGNLTTACSLQTVEPAVQIDDIIAGFAQSRFVAQFFYSSSIDNTRDWVVSGFSAGGHLAAYLSMHADTTTKDAIRAVVTLDSPLSFWDIWMAIRNSQTPTISGARSVDLPDGSGGVHNFTLIPSAVVFNSINSYYEGPNEDPADCVVTTTAPNGVSSVSGNDLTQCFTHNHDRPEAAVGTKDSFVASNTFFDLGSGGIPAFISGSSDDYSVPPESVLSVCNQLGGPIFVSYDTTASLPKPYIADCGSSNVRFALIEGSTHAPWAGIWADVSAWDATL